MAANRGGWVAHEVQAERYLALVPERGRDQAGKHNAVERELSSGKVSGVLRRIVAIDLC
jgi:hypothetical protein